ncbi:lytic transglycosylase domain-containing protein [Silanimonas sp.]|uniref:lytic transglycosylase domain-containing protein n=1 Tax=Silanimonas sp. TaxID=1929290 RepID=UPI0022CCF95F|nr:lytic transglycosylase domain-containing protein [Silanimonas sp.]MCZ8166775.1 lytic transglycosylase domain-containing protein [Silanimonas sp.]
MRPRRVLKPASTAALAGWVALALAIAGGGAPEAQAGTLYRCVGPDGISHYGSRRQSGMTCTVAANYRPDPRPAIAPRPTPTPAAASPGPDAPAPAANPARRVEFLASPGAAPAPAAGSTRGARVTRGAVYTYMKDGVTHYTNVRPQNAGASVRTLFTYVETCYACSTLPGVDFSNVRLNTAAYAAEIRAAAARFGVDEALVRAIVHAESAFNPNAVSHKGAQGLMQLIPATADRFDVSDPFDPAQNIAGGVQYLAWLLDRFDDNITLAAAGYNAGEGNVDRYGGVPPFDETQRYVGRVATLHARYRDALGAAGSVAVPMSGAGAP